MSDEGCPLRPVDQCTAPGGFVASSSLTAARMRSHVARPRMSPAASNSSARCADLIGASAPPQVATVTPFCLSTSNTLGMSGGPGGISLLMAVNICVARPPWPVSSSISPPPAP